MCRIQIRVIIFFLQIGIVCCYIVKRADMQQAFECLIGNIGEYRCLLIVSVTEQRLAGIDQYHQTAAAVQPHISVVKTRDFRFVKCMTIPIYPFGFT